MYSGTAEIFLVVKERKADPLCTPLYIFFSFLHEKTQQTCTDVHAHEGKKRYTDHP